MRRFDDEIRASQASSAKSFNAENIITPKARHRLQELIEREQLPGDVRQTLAGALTGDLRCQQLLFQAMLDTWPRLQKNINEVLGEVCDAPWEINAWSDHGKEASKTSEERAAFAKDAIKGMKPRPHWGELSGGGLTKVIAYGYFAGHHVCEVLWNREAQDWTPYEGRLRLIDQDVGRTQYIGRALNIHDHMPEYRNMRALPQSVDIDFSRGTATISLGSPPRQSLSGMLNRVKQNEDDNIVYA